MHKWYHY